MSELKPCPFCNSEPELQEVKFYGDEYVTCVSFDCSLFQVSFAPQSWNTRPHENKLKADAVREALRYRPKWTVYGAEAQLDAIDEYADKLERGEL